ncbi:MAG: hypothetical protein ACP5P4_05270 [Steroidobacteraceae bacterium]
MTQRKKGLKRPRRNKRGGFAKLRPRAEDAPTTSEMVDYETVKRAVADPKPTVRVQTPAVPPAEPPRAEQDFGAWASGPVNWEPPVPRRALWSLWSWYRRAWRRLID